MTVAEDITKDEMIEDGDVFFIRSYDMYRERVRRRNNDPSIAANTVLQDIEEMMRTGETIIGYDPPRRADITGNL